MEPLPSLSSVVESKEKLESLLSTLFEPSNTLSQALVPHVYDIITQEASLDTYAALITICGDELKNLDPILQAEFIESHPRIGEVNGLSALSTQEQATKATPPEVLARLQHLNEMYERRYTGLRYVVFVNGRSREEIMRLMEQVLLIGPAEPGKENEPPVRGVMPLDVDDAEWQNELHRAVTDVVSIAKARLKSLNVA
jgi:2-oxo-4-hydroxy-4-carboxy--5-ureidoimidazoline (OHCU) decarboxylase